MEHRIALIGVRQWDAQFGYSLLVPAGSQWHASPHRVGDQAGDEAACTAVNPSVRGSGRSARVDGPVHLMLR